MTQITQKIAKKVLETVDAGLLRGIGEPEPGRMCVEAAVCYALGLPHGDHPPCVSTLLRDIKIILNDQKWSSDKARAKGLRRLALAQLGSENISATKLDAQIKEFILQKILTVHSCRKTRRGFWEAIRKVSWARSILPTAKDAIFSKVAEEIVQILIRMKAPGVQWLYLAPLEDET